MSATPPPSVASRRPGALLRSFVPFDRLSEERAAELEPLLQPRRYRMGQTLMRPDVLPEGLLFLLRGACAALGPIPWAKGCARSNGQAPACTAAGLLRAPLANICAPLKSEACCYLLQHLPICFEATTLIQWFQEALNLPELHVVLMALAERDPGWLPLRRPVLRPLRGGGQPTARSSRR